MISERYFWPTVSIIGVVGGWYTLSRVGHIDPFLLPSPMAVLEQLGSLLATGDLVQQAGLTLYRTGIGFGLAVVVGSLLGFWMGKSKAARWFFEPLISVLFPTPKISFLPIFILWFGAFDLSKILIAAFICAFPVISACYEGVKDIDQRLLWVGRNMGIREQKLFWKIMLPAAVPALLNGAEISLPFAFIAVAVSEMLAGGGGVGAKMMLAARFADSKTVFASLITLAVLGALLAICARTVRVYLLQWHTEVEPD